MKTTTVQHIVAMILLLLMAPKSFSATYVLNNEWFKHSHDFGLIETKQSIGKRTNSTNQPLYPFYWTGFTTQTDKLYKFGYEELYGQLGQLEKCDGLGNTCVVLNGYFKIYLPKDFSFEKQQRWRWGKCQYATDRKVNGQLLGIVLTQIRVVAKCADDMFDLVEFDIDQTIGIVQIRLFADEVQINYLLSSESGFFAKNSGSAVTF